MCKELLVFPINAQCGLSNRLAVSQGRLSEKHNEVRNMAQERTCSVLIVFCYACHNFIREKADELGRVLYEVGGERIDELLQCFGLLVPRERQHVAQNSGDVGADQGDGGAQKLELCVCIVVRIASKEEGGGEGSGELDPVRSGPELVDALPRKLVDHVGDLGPPLLRHVHLVVLQQVEGVPLQKLQRHRDVVEAALEDLVRELVGEDLQEIEDRQGGVLLAHETQDLQIMRLSVIFIKLCIKVSIVELLEDLGGNVGVEVVVDGRKNLEVQFVENLHGVLLGDLAEPADLQALEVVVGAVHDLPELLDGLHDGVARELGHRLYVEGIDSL